MVTFCYLKIMILDSPTSTSLILRDQVMGEFNSLTTNAKYLPYFEYYIIS